jgi:hypothetical protein
MSNELEQLNRLKAATGRKPEAQSEPVVSDDAEAAAVREIRWPAQTTDAQGAEYIVTKPKFDKRLGYVEGRGALPKPIVPFPAQLRDTTSAASVEYARACGLRISANIALERLLGNLHAKAMSKSEKYDPKADGLSGPHFVGGESFYANAVRKDLENLRGIWQAMGIQSPTDSALQVMAGLEE